MNYKPKDAKILRKVRETIENAKPKDAQKAAESFARGMVSKNGK